MNHRPEQILEIRDEPSGLLAFLVIDDTTLGPAAGGIRTRAYPAPEAALVDARRLARAMTLKCALAGLDAGGGKCVVLDHPGLDRRAAFAALGDRVEALGGLFRTAGDFGTTAADLEVVARHTRWVHTGGDQLAAAVGRGLRRCAEACAEAAGWKGLAGRRVVVQGVGAVGAAVARELASAGARVAVSDVDAERARTLSQELAGEIVPVDSALEVECDLLSPCAVGGVLTVDVAHRLRAASVCGAANNILAEPRVAEILRDRGILHVPDMIASAGAAIDGIGRTVMGLEDRAPLIDALGRTTRDVLVEAALTGHTPEAVAARLAEQRIAARRRDPS